MTALVLALFPACSRKGSAGEGLESAEETAPSLGEPVAVVLGYGYNDAPFLEELRSLVQERFSTEDTEVMEAFRFPDDFSYGRISLLYDKLSARTRGGLLLLGAPERTHAVLARLQDSWETEGGRYPVVSLFSQDDILGMESGSDIVADFVPLPETPAGAEEEAEESRRIHGDTVVHLLQEMHRRAGEELTADEATVSALLGEKFRVLPFQDAETGLISANHFVIEEKE